MENLTEQQREQRLKCTADIFNAAIGNLPNYQNLSDENKKIILDKSLELGNLVFNFSLTPIQKD